MIDETKSFDERVEERVKEELTAVDMDQLYDEMLDEQGDVEIGCLKFSPSRIVAELDPIAYRCGFSDFTDSMSDQYEEIDGEYYSTEEVQEIRERIEDEIEAENEEKEAQEGPKA